MDFLNGLIGGEKKSNKGYYAGKTKIASDTQTTSKTYTCPECEEEYDTKEDADACCREEENTWIDKVYNGEINGVDEAEDFIRDYCDKNNLVYNGNISNSYDEDILLFFEAIQFQTKETTSKAISKYFVLDCTTGKIYPYDIETMHNKSE